MTQFGEVGHLPVIHNIYKINLTLIGLYVANIFLEYNQLDATFLNVFVPVGRSTCFRRLFVHHQELETAHTAASNR